MENKYSRHCSHCWKPLTDPASRECGVGPVCRNKNNELYAKTIESNLGLAFAIISTIDVEKFPEEVQSNLNFMKKTVLSKLGESKIDENNGKHVGVDFRKFIEHIEFVLSYPTPYQYRNLLVNAVEHLGYVGLASVFRGEASKSKAKIWFENGKLFLEGAYCKTGRLAFRWIPGCRGPRFRGDKTPYSVPCGNFNKFCSIVNKHWPFFEGDMAKLKEESDSWIAEQNEQKASIQNTPQQNIPQAKIVVDGEKKYVTFPWLFERNGEMRDLIAELKNLVHYRDRSWDPKNNRWVFLSGDVSTISNCLKKTFQEIHVENK